MPLESAACFQWISRSPRMRALRIEVNLQWSRVKRILFVGVKLKSILILQWYQFFLFYITTQEHILTPSVFWDDHQHRQLPICSDPYIAANGWVTMSVYLFIIIIGTIHMDRYTINNVTSVFSFVWHELLDLVS